MRKLITIILILSSLAVKGQVLPVNDSIPLAGVGAAYTASTRVMYYQGIALTQTRIGTSSNWYTQAPTKYLRQFYVSFNGSLSNLNMGNNGVGAASYTVYQSSGIGPVIAFRTVNPTVNDWAISEPISSRRLRISKLQATGGIIDTAVFDIDYFTKKIRMYYVADGVTPPDTASKKQLITAEFGRRIATTVSQAKIDSLGALTVKLTGAQTIAGIKSWTDLQAFNGGLSIPSGQQYNHIYGSWSNWHYGTGYIQGDWRVDLNASNLRFRKVGFITSGSVVEPDQTYEMRGDHIYHNGNVLLEPGDILQGNGIQIVGTANSVTINALNAAVNQTSGTSATLTSTGIYIPQNAALTTYTLPINAAVGDIIFINGKGSGNWRIAQNSGQVIHAATDTTTGTGGSLSSSGRYNCVAIRCITANTEWVVQSSNGALTVL